MANKSMAVGAVLLGIGGFVFGVGSAVYNDWLETLWCSSFAAGFLLFGYAVLKPVPRRLGLSAIGLVLASVGGTAWALDAILQGVFPRYWALLGVGVALAALAALAQWRLRDSTRASAWILPAAFGLVFIAGLDLAWNDLAFSIWFAGDLLVALGAAILTFWTWRSFNLPVRGPASA